MEYFLKILLMLLWHSSGHICWGSEYCSSTGKCNSTIYVRWWEIKPYINYIENTTQIDGFFPEILEDLISVCCGNCTEINYDHKEKAESGLMRRFNNLSFINFPVYGYMMDTSKVRKPYLPLIESPGIVYLANNDKVMSSTYHVVIQAVTKAWPILVFIYLGAALSGIAVWALDCYCNWEQFPVNFFKGSWEGFWWSIVSMTTVGYGDRCPKSPAARVFSIVWVMIGLVMIALFNGALTTELTTFSMTSDPIIQGENVAVITGTTEEQYATTIMVNRKSVADINEMKQLLEDKTHNLLLDTYVAGVYRDLLNSSSNLILRDVLEHNFAYGMMLSGDYENSPMKQCLEKQLSLKPYKIMNMILQNMKERNVSTIDFASTPIEQMKKDHLLSPFGPVPQLFYMVCSILVCLFVIGGMIWQFKKRLNDKNQLSDSEIIAVDECATLEELMIRQNTDLEVAMREEVERFYKLWTDQKDKLFGSCCVTGWYQNKKQGDALMESSDLAKYDYIRQFDKFELTTCDNPKSYEDIRKSMKSMGETGLI